LIVGDAVQVCDFGLARMLGADRATTAAASIAYAAADNRAGAVEYERKAVEAEKDPAVKEAYRTRLKRYESQAAQNAKSKAGS
jgi:hypothetical protein